MNFIQRMLLLFLAISLIFAAPLLGQPKDKGPLNDKQDVPGTPDREEPNQEDDKAEDQKAKNEIIITATKSGINKKETGSSITVITAEEIDQTKKMKVVDMLKNIPGVSVSQSSPLGGIADLYMRGTQSNHTTVLIDGVKVNDPSSTGHGFDFAHLTTDNIDRIEIVRGSQSVLYGSDAIGGVINIITKKGEGKPQVTVQAEGGSFKTFKESAGVSGGTDWAYYSFNVSRTDSKGFSRTSTWRGIRKSFLKDRHDGYDTTAVSTQVGLKTIHDSWLSLSLRFTDSKTKIANGAFEEDKNHTFENQNLALNIKYNIPLFEWWESTLLYTFMNQYQRDKNQPDAYEYATSYVTSGGYPSLSYSNMSFKGNMMSGEFKNRFSIMDIDEIVCGVSYEKEWASTMPYWFYYSQFYAGAMDFTEPIDKSDGTWAVYAQNHLKLLKRIFIIAGGRYTKPDHFEDSIDYGVSGSFIVPVTETRFKASTGTGYKIPSLYQLYNVFDRYRQFTWAYLKPERTLSYDAGIEQSLWKDRIVLEINYFNIDYKNLIVYDIFIDRSGRYWNSEGLTRGVECIASFKPIDDIVIKGYYTYTRSYDKFFHTGDMVRRPRHQAGITVNYTFLKKGNINAGFNYVGKRRDYYRFPHFSYMNPYYRLDLSASWWIIEQLQAFFRVENVLNKKYDEVRGYRAAPCSVYGGLKAVF
ncbi:MAG TPA: TonB-dependent receptor [Spirochaetota bacterium]|nr:TonB-dependent receptor [Spirochaetota bacterium]HPC41459.1 TonB-dependent receptor [Spirochaetota bacterium]HPL17162.1 TonB-dependent receptor [Spirochaetota bacterium]HQF10455.1 TonB-dependent receptor [Spirochaetota bacterium]HQH99424.1 TonB-dependent receptor [Spirochaetota bacterium]